MFCSAIKMAVGAAMMAAVPAVAQQMTQGAQDKVVKINQIQVIGSHNS